MKNYLNFYFLISLLLVITISLVNLPSAAQSVTSAKIIEILDSDRVFIQNQKAQKNDVAQLGKEIRTEAARVGLRLNNNAGIRLGQNSSFIVGSQCVQIRGGQAIIFGRVRGCIGSVVAVTRGTIYTLELDINGEEKIQVLEGKVDLFDLKKPRIKIRVLNGGERIFISQNGQIGGIQAIPQIEIDNILTGPLFQGFETIFSGTNSQGGFTETFLNEAMVGMSDPLNAARITSTLSNDISIPLSSNTIGETNPAFVEDSSINGRFTVIKFGGRETIGTFTDNNGNTTNIRVIRTSSQTTIQVNPTITIGNTSMGIDTPATTPLINGIPARDFSFGLSGNDTLVTVVGEDGQIFRARAIGIGGKSPKAGDSFPGVLSIGNAPDR
ncbi:MAG TPA: hypothetical protein DEG17_08630 [Cyanobacteria bacterium UBA11149]|nr:hypothetical protein [Cyanobacteria bacterium UBA11367]HBE58679.1 hypothetical protein [Cyanobacteria bacterium UBA11366]HBK65757.1 hypothetical protein [Cyanobacteria bacterium UBA11166]HBR77166.1 hypothetical protein [Cyanobacteria bacterium UBA11159]HBS69042.1 hypothetical protein [Cyanobacteria bacterium UBA11153]HBW88924.1 hypothetical protein [Cyanobacteria bacterium UBA11149]HCA97138.1 hypothetical protein [Cyanobacteria bacterium UBA9226]